MTSSLGLWNLGWPGHSFQPAVENLLAELQKCMAADCHQRQQADALKITWHCTALSFSPVEVKEVALGAADVTQTPSGRERSIHTNPELHEM